MPFSCLYAMGLHTKSIFHRFTIACQCDMHKQSHSLCHVRYTFWHAFVRRWLLSQMRERETEKYWTLNVKCIQSVLSHMKIIVRLNQSQSILIWTIHSLSFSLSLSLVLCRNFDRFDNESVEHISFHTHIIFIYCCQFLF